MTVENDPLLAAKQIEVKDAKFEFMKMVDYFVKNNNKVKNAFEAAPSQLKRDRNHYQIVLEDMMHAFASIMAETIENSDAEFDDLPSEFYVQLYRDRNGPTVKKPEAIEALKEAIEAKNNEPPAMLAEPTANDPDWFHIIKDDIHPGQLGGFMMNWKQLVDGFSALLMKGQALAAQNSADDITQNMMQEVMRIQQEAAQSGEMGAAMNGAGNMTESPAQLLQLKADEKVTFKDVAGIDEAVEEVSEVVDFLKNPERYKAMGAKIPKGIMLHGGPGTGKTLLARATAGEAGVPFYFVSGSDFVEMFVGVGAARVREMFKELKENQPCILFIDEIDAVGGKRSGSGQGGSKEADQTINALLTELDGVGGGNDIILMAATNRLDILDTALMRPGRFDRKVEVPTPDLKGREKILEIHTRDKPLVTDKNDPTHVDLKHVARGMTGASGADLANLANEATLNAIKEGRDKVTHDDFAEARDNVRMGRQKKSRILSEEEVKNTAYHEVGHALTNLVLEPWCNDFDRVTIVPRGGALGVSMSLPKEGRASRSHIEFLAGMIMTAGGRAAEEIKFGKHNVTGGASSDIDHNTATARMMIENLGFSEKHGPVRLSGARLGDIFSGAGAGAQSNISDATREAIEEEIVEMIKDADHDAKRILEHNKDVFEEWSQDLLEHETVDRRDVEEKYLSRLELPDDLKILQKFDLGTDKEPLPKGAQTRAKPS